MARPARVARPGLVGLGEPVASPWPTAPAVGPLTSVTGAEPGHENLVGGLGHRTLVLRSVLEVDEEALAVTQELDAGELGLAVLEVHDPDAAVGQDVRIVAIAEARPDLVIRAIRV